MWYQFHPSGTSFNHPFEALPHSRQLLIVLSSRDVMVTKLFLFAARIYRPWHQSCCMYVFSVDSIEVLCPADLLHPPRHVLGLNRVVRNSPPFCPFFRQLRFEFG